MLGTGAGAIGAVRTPPISETLMRRSGVWIGKFGTSTETASPMWLRVSTRADPFGSINSAYEAAGSAPDATRAAWTSRE